MKIKKFVGTVVAVIAGAFGIIYVAVNPPDVSEIFIGLVGMLVLTGVWNSIQSAKAQQAAAVRARIAKYPGYIPPKA